MALRVVVVGAGMGGLACAVDLAAAGLNVTLVERAAAPGGKIRELPVAGVRVDSGPTVLTMRWVLEELFAQAGARLDAEVPMDKAGILARHAWDDRAHLDLHADEEQSADAIGAFAGPREARGFRTFCARAREVYGTLENAFIRGERPTPLSLVARAGGVTRLLRIKPFETLWRELGTHFSDVRLQQLFGRYATYCGSSPFRAPATLMLVAHVEQQGVWRVRGGMQRLAEALTALAVRKGAQVRFGAAVERVVVERGAVVAVELAGGESLAADAVVVNADAGAVAAGLLGGDLRRAVDAVPPAERSLSAVTLGIHAHTGGFPLSRHNVFFGGNYPAEFAQLCDQGRLPQDPTVYVCAQDRGDHGLERTPQVPNGPLPGDKPERLFCIINAPANGDGASFSQAELAACAQRAIQRMNTCGLKVTPLEEPRITGPVDFEQRFPGTGGALYGRATHGAMASFARPGARTTVRGLYLAGGSVHPGPGVPMAALSGRQAARSLLQDWRLTAPSPGAGTPGGTWTR